MTLRENPADRSRSSRWPDGARPTRRPLSADALGIDQEEAVSGDSSVVLSASTGSELIKNRTERKSLLFAKRHSCESEAITGFRAFIRSVARADWCWWPLRVDACDNTRVQSGLDPGQQSQRERERTEQRCLPVPCVTQDLPRILPGIILPWQIRPESSDHGPILSVLSCHLVLCRRLSVFDIHSFVPEPIGSPDAHSGQPGSL